jgi:neurofibromin 1
VDDSDEWLGNSVDDTDTIVLHRFFHKYNDKIGKELLSQAKPANEEDSAIADGSREAWGSLCTALVDIGMPLEVPQLSLLPRSEHGGYKNLMARYAQQDSDAIRDIFVETSLPQVSPAVHDFFYIYYIYDEQ